MIYKENKSINEKLAKISNKANNAENFKDSTKLKFNSKAFSNDAIKLNNHEKFQNIKNFTEKNKQSENKSKSENRKRSIVITINRYGSSNVLLKKSI
jgi:hypothetical protein